MSRPRFVAIDFETANEQSDSACAIGIAVVEDGRVVECREFLIRPPEIRFTPFTIAIHGIRPEDVEDAPEFHALWPDIAALLGDGPLLAHNARFDFAVLAALLRTYQIDRPDHATFCSLLIAKALWPDLRRHRLNHLAWHFGIELDHHKAGSDARACAEITLRALDAAGQPDLGPLAAALSLQPGNLGDLTHCRGLTRQSASGQRPPLPIVLPNPDLAGRRIVFTGTLDSLDRDEAETLARQAGLVPQAAVSGQTAFLVQGRITDSGKLRSARRLMAKGQGPLVLRETEFRLLLGLAGPPVTAPAAAEP